MLNQKLGQQNTDYMQSAVPPKQPALGSLYEALKHVSEAAATARNVADQLCGGQPESVGEKDAPKSASYFGQLDDIASEFRSQANRIVNDMQRVLGKL